MSFWGLIRQRSWGLVLVVAGVCVITFIISHLIPGDPARLLAGDRASDEIVRHIRQQLGLDLPLWQQFFHYVNALLHGDLGTSIRTGRPVLEDLKTFFPATLELAICALFIALVVGIPLGTFGGISQPLDRSPGSPDGADRNLDPGVLAGAGSDCPVLRQTGLAARQRAP